jgi:RNase P/RNase MRP subunit p30
MSGFHDFLIDSDIQDLAGWNREAAELNTVILEASDWGELKRKIGEKREDADILVFRGDKDFNARACEDSRLDILLVGGDSRIAQSTAEAASQNGVAIAFDFSELKSDRVEKMKSWKTDIKILEKHGADYIITTNAEREEDIRAPRDIASLINELGGEGLKAVKEVPSRLMEEALERKSDRFIGKGVEEM